MPWTLKLKSIETGEVQDYSWSPTADMVTDYGVNFIPGWLEISGVWWRVVGIDDVASDPVVNRRDFRNRPPWVDGAVLANGKVVAGAMPDTGGGVISP